MCTTDPSVPPADVKHYLDLGKPSCQRQQPLTLDVEPLMRTYGYTLGSAEAEGIREAQTTQANAGTAFLDALKAEIQAQEDRIGALATRQQAEFLEQEELRQKAATEAGAQAQAAANEQAARIDTEASETLQALERYRDEAARLVNAVGQNAFAGGFGVYANEERAAANFWRWVTFGSIAAIVAAGLSYLYTVGNAEFSIQAFWVRAAIIVPWRFWRDMPHASRAGIVATKWSLERWHSNSSPLIHTSSCCPTS